ncbi:MAG: hypothetical protein LBT36_05980 [Oscillospiraceae bacterium]|jgi:hypothetical protein|nr:hypothetical protein [Oscillospiraceae bacterium]
MKKLLFPILALCLFAALTACDPAPDAPITSPDASADVSPDATPSAVPQSPLPLPPKDADPYYPVFERLFATDEALNDGIKYIAVDLTKIKAAGETGTLPLLRAFCEDNGFTLLEDTYETLLEKGLIRDLYFEEGILIEFEDVSFARDKLITNARKWRSGLGALGAEFTVERQDASWTITASSGNWIS